MRTVTKLEKAIKELESHGFRHSAAFLRDLLVEYRAKEAKRESK